MREARCPECGRELLEGARFCAFCGIALDSGAEESGPGPPPSAPDEREERKVVTALFADIVGSTQLGERLDPEDFRNLVGGAVAVMGEAIEELGGRVRGSAGDAVLGLFGAPAAREDDPERAVLAGLRVIERMRAYGHDAGAELGIEKLDVRIGIETGLAVLGAVRAGRQIQYDASGDCLNTAARLQAQADPGGVLVGPLTHRLIEAAFEWEEPRTLSLKGKSSAVMARHARAQRPAGLRRRDPHLGAPLVGRDRELALADEVVGEVYAGAARTIVITGEAGIGKSRLLGEIQASFASGAAPGARARWLESHCLSYAGDEPFLPFRGLLREALDERAGAGGSAGDAFAELLGEERADRLAPVLELVLGETPDKRESAEITALSREALQSRVAEAVAAVATALSETGPVALVVDDFHWADVSSARLAVGLTREIRDAPVLLVWGMRPERDQPAWGLMRPLAEAPGEPALHLQLEGLGQEAELALVAALVGKGTLPESLQAELLARTEGNPFFLGELIRSLRDSGALVRVGDAWRLDRDVPIELPDTVERVVLARIDRLSAGDRALLTAASVIGRTFDLQLLRWIARSEVSPSALDNLTALGLIEAETPGAEYRFTHPLIQEAAYNGMLRRQRAELHGRAAAAIEELAGEGDEQHAALARHHSVAGNLAGAAKYHRLAGLAAQRVYAMEEALTQFDAALKAAQELDSEEGRRQLPELHLLRGHARGRTGDFDGGAGDFRRALELARAVGDSQVEIQALTDLGWVIRGHGYEEAIEHHEQALRKAEALDDEHTQVTALSRLSLIYSNRLQLDRALDVAERALSIARRSGDDELLGRALDAMKLAALQIGDLELLERLISEITAQEQVADLYLVQWAWVEGSTIPLARGDYASALARIDRALELRRRLGVDPIANAMILEARSWIDRARGELTAAVETMRAEAEKMAQLETPEWSAWVGATLGSHLIEAGEHTEAVFVLESALASSEEIKSPNRALRAASHLAWARWLAGDPEGARAALGTAEKLRSQVTAPPSATFLNGYHSYLAIARTQMAMERWRDAESVLAHLLAAARDAGWLEAEASASALLDQITAARPVRPLGE